MIRSLTGSEPDVINFNCTFMIFREFWVKFWRNEYLPWYIASYNNRLYSVGYWCMSISSSRKISDLWPLSMFVLSNDVWTKKSTNDICCWWCRGCWIVWNAKIKVIRPPKLHRPKYRLHRCRWQVDVGDFMLATIFGCWWQNFDIGDIFWMLVLDDNVKIKTMLGTKTAITVTNISKLSLTHFVSHIRQQHRCCP